ncbi:TetR/AcrR family transcriptional regulator [Micromonospora sp. WMMD998]|uniref:TetR/AcrR family transcriptional regulator n=1 Tax=Micromonospora sp. WMMD998 TaxID=3016092 RepID=UPI00249CAE91|nr:TetR/AcrR family transcriptional regulator [Micromonospora sp. WMMD998]WFE40750.1 TetR/AcrR family transcriptional regulator [Micromonospora sp. WMMD998]
MSELTGGRRRRRRSDAERSAAAVLDAAVQVLGRHPDAKVEQVAAAAGVTRQTVYAHYPSRPLLVAAVVDRITAEAVAALDAADVDADDVDSGTVTEALLRWLDVTWRLFDRYPLLLHPSVTAIDQAESDRQHAGVNERLERLIRHGQATGEFDGTLSPAWLVSATIALGHAAGGEVAAGRMTTAQMAAVLRPSILRLYGVREP